MSTVYPSCRHLVVLCIGVLASATSATAAPTAADVAKLQALQQQLDDLSQQLALLMKAREIDADQPPTQTHGSMSAPNDEVSLLEADTRGAQLVSKYCSQCHAAPSPSLHTQEEWTGVTQRMRGHIGEAVATGRGILMPSAPDLNALTRYLGEHSTLQH